ncbi:hypothetical protein SB7C_12175, partial [Staphylococcus epidermidis]
INAVIDGAKSMAGELGKLKDVEIGMPKWLGGDGFIQQKSEQPSSHASGISNVPYNGYLARLHKGERVLTPEDNETYNKGGSAGGSYSFGDIHIHGASGNPEEFADQLMGIMARRVSEAGGQM